MKFIKCESCGDYCHEGEVEKSEVSNKDVCSNCGMICTNCNRYIHSSDYFKTSDKCEGCDDFF